MSDTFVDNQEVTAQDLNNIAIDLGYADYNHFPENPPQSAVAALNEITKDLVSAGVLQCLNKCNVTVSGGKIYVDTGIIVFESGAKKRIETAQSFDYVAGTTVYVYALNDTVNNTISLICSDAAAASGDYVNIAKVVNGVVTMMRTFASAKVALTTTQQYYHDTSKHYAEFTINVGFSTFNIITYSYKYSNSNIAAPCTCVCSSDGTYHSDAVNIIRNGSSIKFVPNINIFSYVEDIYIS